ncbi:MAG TPA: ATP-binding cassette domain-containing protein [Bacteroidota bacterium]
MIVVENVSKTYKMTREQKRELGKNAVSKTVDAVKDVSFTCQPGRVFTLLGPNGAGKTTLLRIIATMLKPTGGTVKIAGHDVLQEPQQVRRKLGFLTGGTGLYDRLTPDEIVKYYAELHGMDEAAFRQRKTELFSFLGIDEFAKRRIGKLSSGMKQKVSIVRTIIHDPDVVVFDEPTAALDVIAARNIIDLIKRSRQQGKTIIFSTHRMDEVSLLSDDLAIIHKGSLLYNGAFTDFQRQMKTKSVEDEFIRIVEAA